MTQAGAGVPHDAPKALRLTALALFVLFAFALLPKLSSPALFDPSWQLGLISDLLGVAVFPLLGLSLLLVAATLDSRDPRARQLPIRLRRLALLAGAGFLLLLPVQISAMLRLGGRTDLAGRQQIVQLQEGRSQIAASRNLAELVEGLRGLPGSPRLPQGFNRPLESFRRELLANLDRSIATLEERQRQQIRGRRLGEASMLLRMGGLQLLFAGLYSELGGLSLLAKIRRLGRELRRRLKGGWKRSRRRGGSRRRQGSR